MNIRKALSYICYGLLITVFNININFNDTSILNLLPEFIGWIILFLAYDFLGHYVSNKPELKPLAIVLAVIGGISWIMQLTNGQYADLTLLGIVRNLCSAYFIHKLCDVMEEIAADCGSLRGPTINMLKNINLVCELTLAFIGFLSMFTNPENLAVIVIIVGAVALIAIIATVITFFGLRNDYTMFEQTMKAEESGY